MKSKIPGIMNNLPNISKWPVSLIVSVILIAAFASTRPTQAQNASPPASGRALGLVRALVVDILDPEAAGRIKVRFPLRRSDVEAWARVSLPLGGNQTGLWSLPAIGDEVLVGFESGDVRNPIAIGSLWNGKVPPPTSGRR